MTNKNKKFNFDFGTFLLVTGALSNVTLWIGAFLSTEAQGPVNVWIREYIIPVLGGISGLSMGLTVAFGLVYVLVHLGKMQPTLERKVRGKDEIKTIVNYRFWFATVAIVLLLVISPALLSPYVLMLIANEKTLYSVLGIQWAGGWAVGRVVAADLALGAIALVHGVQLGAVASAAGATQSNSLSEISPARSRSAKKIKSLVLVTCRYQGAGCKQTGSQNAMNAHAPHCKFKPTIDDSLMIKSQSQNKAAEKS